MYSCIYYNCNMVSIGILVKEMVTTSRAILKQLFVDWKAMTAADDLFAGNFLANFASVSRVTFMISYTLTLKYRARTTFCVSTMPRRMTHVCIICFCFFFVVWNKIELIWKCFQNDILLAILTSTEPFVFHLTNEQQIAVVFGCRLKLSLRGMTMMMMMLISLMAMGKVFLC